jgi:glycosyltransferase involved in cell wall biosynthesis
MLRTLGDQHNATLRQVHFLAVGTRAGAAEHYRFAHVTASPAKHEPFGLVLIESLACGTPVVGATPGGMASIVNGDTIGRLAACDDARAIAAAILHCIDLSRRPETPGRCREHAQRWDWETSVGPAHEALYAEAASRTNARR